MFKTFFLNLSLNKKLILMMLFLSFILLTILFFLYWQSEKALLNQLASQTAELSKAIQIGVEEVTGSGSTDEMRLAQYLKNLNAKGIKEISIISNTDEIIASTNPGKIGSPVSPKKKELIIKAELGEPVSKEGKAYNVILPVVAGDAHYGYIHLRINAEDISALQKANFIRRALAALSVFAIGIVIAVLLSLKYTEPIKEIVMAAKKVAGGDLDVVLPASRKDEIGELTESFNFMVRRLKENKEIEERLREAEHLSAVGQLARSIAHEIRNPLNFINLSIDHIKDCYRPASDEDARNFQSLIGSIKQEIHRLNKLVNDFLDYGRPLRLNRQSIDAEILFKEVIEIINAKASSEGIAIEKNLKFLPKIFVDSELIKTCLFNVIINAFQAMPDGGTLTLETEKENNRFAITVSDTGKGVPGENISRVFDPFFSTKPTGLGLGLAITKRIIEDHGGTIEFYSTEGKGSKVVIKLPLNNMNMAPLST